MNYIKITFFDVQKRKMWHTKQNEALLLVRESRMYGRGPTMNAIKNGAYGVTND